MNRDNADAHFSSGGRWLAYSSIESGTVEVYTRAFPGPGAKHRISISGGQNPTWSRNGRDFSIYSEGKAAK